MLEVGGAGVKSEERGKNGKERERERGREGQ